VPRVLEPPRIHRQPVSSTNIKVPGFLLESEEKVYGNRCPEGYVKKELLGKGGCAVVWLGQRDSELVAMK